jgi:hypothetical protein
MCHKIIWGCAKKRERRMKLSNLAKERKNGTHKGYKVLRKKGERNKASPYFQGN